MPTENASLAKPPSEEAGGDTRNAGDGSFLALPSFGYAGSGYARHGSLADKGAAAGAAAPDHRTVLLSDYGDDDEDDEEESRGEGRSGTCCFTCVSTVIRMFFPDATPVLMFLTLCAVSSFLCFMRASEGGAPLSLFFGLYLGFSLALLLVFLTGRVIWVYVLGRYIALPASKLYTILASVLDPETVYLAYTIGLAIFWAQALEVTHEPSLVVPPAAYGPGSVTYIFLRIRALAAAAGPDDRAILRRAEYVLIIWGSRNVIMKVIMFYFVVGFLKSVNTSLVKFLTLYSLIRKLNANWIRLTPVRNELTRTPSIMPAVNSPEEMFPDYTARANAQASAEPGSISPRFYSPTPRTSFTAANPTNAAELNMVDAPFAGPHAPAVPLGTPSQSTSLLPQVSVHAAQVVDELLAAEAFTKEKKQTRSVAGSVSNTPFRRLRTIVESTKVQQTLKERYQVEFTGRSLAPLMLRKNIEETQRSGIANLIAVQYIQNNAVALFVRGTRVELHSTNLARLVGTRLFEELIEFRNAVAPDEELSAEEMDLRVRQSVIQTAELQHLLNKQASSHIRPNALQQTSAEHQPYGPTGSSAGAYLSKEAWNASGSAGFPVQPAPANIAVAPITQTVTGVRGTSVRDVQNTAAPQSTPPTIPVPLVPAHPVASSSPLASTPSQLPVLGGTTAGGIRDSVNVSVVPPPANEAAAAYEINVSAPETHEESSPTPADSQINDEVVPHQTHQRHSDGVHGARLPPIRHFAAADAKNKAANSGDLKMQDGPAIPIRRSVEGGALQGMATKTGRLYLTRELFELFMGDQVNEFMKYADRGGRDRVAMDEFTRMIIELYQLRKQLISLINRQEDIQMVFRRMVSIFLGFLAALIFFIVMGVSANTIIISGAAAASSITVALSFLYSGFIQSVMFVCFFNPYNVGDRIRLNDELLIVKKISTYFSEFVSVPYNKPSFWNHSTLYNMIVVNESRCRNAGLEIPVTLAYDTDPTKYEALHKFVEDYVNNNREFVKGCSFYLMNDVIVGHYIKFTYWITCTESWHRWKAVYNARTRLWIAIANQCHHLGIDYRLPVQPISLRPDRLTHQLGNEQKEDSEHTSVKADSSQNVLRRRK